MNAKAAQAYSLVEAAYRQLRARILDNQRYRVSQV